MKTNIIAYIVVGVVVVAGIVFAMTRGGDGETKNYGQSDDMSQEQVSTSDTSAKSMKDLVARGESLKCEFSQSVEGTESEGVIYVADGKVRGDFTSTVAAAGGQKFNSYMIADGSYTYVWSSMMQEGFKFPIQSSSSSQGQAQGGVDYNQALDYRCESWNKDTSVFTPPASITFRSAPAY